VCFTQESGCGVFLGRFSTSPPNQGCGILLASRFHYEEGTDTESWLEILYNALLLLMEEIFINPMYNPQSID
jgi:hypothetical protein